MTREAKIPVNDPNDPRRSEVDYGKNEERKFYCNKRLVRKMESSI